MCFITEIVVLHIIELIKYLIIEHIGKHVLFSYQTIICHFRKFSFRIYPTLSIISNANPIVSWKFSSQRSYSNVGSIK